MTQSSPDIQLYKKVQRDKIKGGIYIAGAGLDLWDVIEKKVGQYLTQIGIVQAGRKEHIFKLFIHQLKDYRKDRMELLEKNKPSGTRWIYIPDNKRYNTVEYLAYYKRYVKMVFLSFVKESTAEKQGRFVETADAWERDVARLPAGKEKSELMETVAAVRDAAHRLGSARVQALNDLNGLFNINQTEPAGKRAKK
jgi:hypothetical protein